MRNAPANKSHHAHSVTTIFTSISEGLSYASYNTAAIYNACDMAISPLKKLQNSFLKKTGLLNENTLLQFNLAPLESRQHFSILKLFHRHNFGNEPKHFKTLFKHATTPRRNTTSECMLHSKQLINSCGRRFILSNA